MKGIGLRGAIALTIFLGLVGGIIGHVQALLINIPASRDNTLYEDQQGDVSNGAGSHFFVGSTGNGGTRRGLIAFDIAAHIPAGAVITSVTLKLRMTRTESGSQDIALHKLQADWGEGTSDAPQEEGGGAPATPGDATWKHAFFPDVFWATQGGDFSATVSATTTVNGPGFYTWISTPEMVADVRAWLDQPSTNFGWLLQGNESNSRTTKRFDTREAAVRNRPVLTVEFSPGCAGQVATIVGTDGDDVLLGTNEDDVIVGLNGNDVIHSLSGNDIICGGAGDDVIFGDGGADRLLGEAGNDVLHGGPGADRLFGGAGHDVLLGEEGDDVLRGSSGDDSLHGGGGNDRLFGESGHDTLRGDTGDDALNGGLHIDVCDGGGGTDTDAGACDTKVNIP